MADYSSTFTETDGVDTVDAADFSTEFDAIAVASATKVNSTNPVLNGAATGTALARGALVSMTADQTITTATYTPVGFDAETYDTDAIHDTVTNNTRLTVPAGVTKIKLSAMALWPNAISASAAYCGFRKNGTGSQFTADAGLPFDVIRAPTSFDSHHINSAIIDVVATDYFELIVYHNTGSNVDLDADSTNFGKTWFAMEIIK